MKKKFLSTFLLCSLLCSCSRKLPTVKMKDYITEIDLFKEQDEVKIMQLTDLHYSFFTDFQREQKYIKKLVEIGDPDIIMVTGDIILGADENTYNQFFEILEGLKNSKGRNVFYGITWGNHDRQGYFDMSFPDYIAKKHTSSDSYRLEHDYTYHGLYRHPESSLPGRSNYVVNITDGDKVIWQLYSIDTNSDHFNGITYDYDVIHDEQIQWFKDVEKETRGGDTNIHSLAFFHIPLYETAFSYDAAKRKTNPLIKEGDFGGELYESPSNIEGLKEYNLISDAVYVGYKKTDFFSVAKERGVKGMFYGHDHMNNFWALYDDKAYYDENTKTVINPNSTDDDVLLAYGTKSSNYLSDYLNQETNTPLGANLITIHKDGSFNGRERSSNTDFKFIHLSYSEIE